MHRQKNTRSTHIYWLIDVRPETIAEGWSNGEPFYCGKTVVEPKRRLSDHKQDAKRYPNRKSAKYVIKCANHIRMDVVEVVSVGGDWIAREKRWIELLRFSFPNTTNVAAGGQGMAGCIPSAETRAKMRAARLGRKIPPEVVAKIAASNRGKKHSAAFCARVTERNRGRTASDETRAKMRLARLGRRHSIETIIKISKSNMKPKRARHV